MSRHPTLTLATISLNVIGLLRVSLPRHIIRDASGLIGTVLLEGNDVLVAVR